MHVKIFTNFNCPKSLAQKKLGKNKTQNKKKEEGQKKSSVRAAQKEQHILPKEEKKVYKRDTLLQMIKSQKLHIQKSLEF